MLLMVYTALTCAHVSAVSVCVACWLDGDPLLHRTHPPNVACCSMRILRRPAAGKQYWQTCSGFWG